MKLFSYGSNMLTARIMKRISQYKVLTIGYLDGYRLRFHKRSVDGSGKADVVHTGNPQDRVWGVVGEVSLRSKAVLDQFEGLGNGYLEAEVQVITEQGLLTASMYVAEASHIDDSQLPYDWYRDYAIRGAEEHNMPEGYLRFLASHAFKQDSNEQRRAENYAIMGGAPARRSVIGD